MDMLGDTLEKKIYRLEKWIMRLNKEMQFLREVYYLTQKVHQAKRIEKVVQGDFFGT